MSKFYLLKSGVCCALTIAALTAQASRPLIPTCEKPPQINAVLDDAAWQTALKITGFKALQAQNPALGTNITAYVTCDDTWLYVGFDILHPQPLNIVPVYQNHDDPVQREDCVKIAFDPGTEGKLWYHFRLNAGNTRSEQRNSQAKGFEPDWNIPWRSATRITEYGWQAEIALPFSILMELGDPKQARLNLLAYIFTPEMDPYGVETGKTRQMFAWAETTPAWWNAPEKFISLDGLADIKFKAAFLPLLEKAEVKGYEFSDSNYHYRLQCVLENVSSLAGTVTLQVLDQPVAGKQTEVLQTVALEAGMGIDYDILVPVNSVAQRDVQVNMLLETGEKLAKVLIKNPSALDLFTAYLDRNYYTTEEQAWAICRIGLPEAGLQDTRLLVRLGKDGEVVGHTSDVKPQTICGFPVSDLPNGKHQLQIEFAQLDGTLISSQTEELTKLPPKPGCEWKIDRIRRMVLRDGEPFFAYGMLLGGWNRNVYNEENYRALAEAGFNTVMYWAGSNHRESALAALDTAAKHNLFMIVQALGFAGGQSGFKPALPPEIPAWRGFTGLKGELMLRAGASWSREKRSQLHSEIFAQAVPYIRAGIEAVKDHPALMAYESFDEPVYDNWFNQYLEGRKLHQLIHEIDGYRPVRVLWNQGSPTPIPQYTDWQDIIARDPYWAPPLRGVRQSPNFVARDTVDAVARGKVERKPVWQTPVLERYSGHNKRMHLPAEQRAQTYLALMYEASGLFYFVYPAMIQSTWDMMAQLGREIQALYPFLINPVPEHTVVYRDLDVDIINNKMPDVHAALRQNADGDYALLALNSQPWPVNATFTLPFADTSQPVKRKFARQTFELQNCEFTDTIEPFDRRVYLFSGAKDLEDLVITVAQTPLQEGYAAESTVARSGRIGCKNILPNPDFEDAALPGWPDYWGVASHAVPTVPSERTGRENAIYSLDSQEPYHGQYSFRIRQGGYVYIHLSPQHVCHTPYVWSFWMKTNYPENMTVNLRGNGIPATARFSPTAEWKRYHIALEIPANAGRHNSYAVRVESEIPDACIWIDAMQFELGQEPTNFEP